MAQKVLLIFKVLLIICIALLALLTEHWLIIVAVLLLALLQYPWLRKTRKQSVHDDTQSPLNNLLNNTDTQTVKELMDFGLWEFRPSDNTFTLSPKCTDLLFLPSETSHINKDDLIESISDQDKDDFNRVFALEFDQPHLFIEVRTNESGVYNQWLRFTGQRIEFKDKEKIYAGRLVEATSKVLVKRTQREMRELLTDVIEHRNVSETLQHICQAVADIEPAINCIIFLSNEAGNKPVLLHDEALSQEFLSILNTVTLGEQQAEYALTSEQREPLYIADLNKINAWRSTAELDYREQIKTYIGQTLYSSNNQVKGVVALYMPNDAISREVLEVLISSVHKVASISIDKHLEAIAKDYIQQQLYHSQKMDTLGYLTGGIAHDFNNILGSIVGYNNLASKLAKKIENEQIQGYIDEVAIAAARARDLIDQMMAYSRAEPVEKLIVEPELIIKEVIQLVRSMIPASIEIRYKFSNDIPRIVISPISLHQIILNHLINAKDSFTSHSGVIDINVYPLKKIEQTCRSCNKRFSGNYVAVAISDNGSGISPEIENKIFDPFFTTKDVGRGTGMGLSVVHSLLHDAHSHITFETTIDQGTTFTLYFPEETDASTEMESADVNLSEEQDSKGEGQHIIVVDDDVSLSLLMEEILANNGYRVSRFVSGLSAYQAFASNPAKYDLVLTDQTMPGMTGDEMAQKMIQMKAHLPVIVCTGYSEKLTKELADEIGIKTIFKKPVDISLLLDEIAQQLSQN